MKQFSLLITLFVGAICSFAGEFHVSYDSNDVVQAYAVKRLKTAFADHSIYPDMSIRFNISDGMPTEAYLSKVDSTKDGVSVAIQAGDSSGLLYGSLSLVGQVEREVLDLQGGDESARFDFRALKFNLPWVSYRAGDALSAHEETCRDLAFWESFLDMMVDNRYNALTLWSLHPFHLMIRNEKFPEACDLSDAELAEWQAFWRGLFAMAKERGIETYIVNWNVFVSPSFAKHHNVAEYCQENISSNYNGRGDRSPKIKDYMRTTVTQLIDTYPDLTGLGIIYGERMSDFTPAERQQWFNDTFIAGMKNASRPIRFINRLPFSEGSEGSGIPGVTTEQLTRDAIESLDLPTTIITEAKFNWSHAHSTTKLRKIHGGQLGDVYWNPPPESYKIHWMVRNEDFFALRWCEPDFIREHIQLNGHDYVGGYYLGSECYIPAKDYITAPDFVTGYAFERQWLYYMAWGRLLYDPDLPDDFFIQACRDRYGNDGETLFEALKLSSRMPLRLASFYNVGWDFTIYSEGFMSKLAESNPDRLITVDELIERGPLDPDYLSVSQYCRMVETNDTVPSGKTSPLQLAGQCEQDSQEALKLVDSLDSNTLSNELMLEVVDVKAWAYLQLHFAEKLRAAVALHHFREQQNTKQGELAIEFLEKAVNHWERLSDVTELVYHEMPLAQVHSYKGSKEEDPRLFHWKRLLPAVQSELQRVKEEVAQ